MDGETIRVTITGGFTFLGVVIASLIASRTTIITSQIALKQVEAKERATAEAALRAEEERDAEIEELRGELEAMRKTKPSVVESKGSGYEWMKKYRTQDRELESGKQQSRTLRKRK